MISLASTFFSLAGKLRSLGERSLDALVDAPAASEGSSERRVSLAPAAGSDLVISLAGKLRSREVRCGS